MTLTGGTYRLELLGTFCLYSPAGERIDIGSRKGMALVAMLAMAARGERTRTWLQDRLWGSRQKAQAQQSLRRELGNLRRLFPTGEEPIIHSDYERVRLDLTRCSVDALALVSGAMPLNEAQRAGEFLEGFDIPGEDGFEDWLREQRRMLAERLAAAPAGAATAVERAAPTAAGERWRPPSVAVLPPSAPAQDQLLENAAERLAELLVDRLSRLRWLSVIAPSTIVSLQSGPGDRAAIGAAVGARYLLEVNVLRKESAAAMTASLTESATWRTLLSRRIALPEAGSSVEISDAVRDLVAAIDAQVETAEQERALAKPLDQLSGVELIWRARWHLERLTRADAATAQELIDKVLVERPNAPEALMQAGFCRAWTIWTGRQPAAQTRELRSIALRAIAADRFDARGHLLVGMAETWLRRPDRARLALNEAISLNPSLCQAYMQLGSALYLAGDAEAALAPIAMALQLNSQDSQIFSVLAERAMVYCMLGDYDRAVESAELSLLRKPAFWYAHVIKVNALARRGDIAAARSAHADLLAARPGFTADHIDWLPFVDNAWLEFLREGLRLSRIV